MGGYKQVGELLVGSGIISAKTLERALDRQKGSGRRIGEVLEEMGVVTEEEIVDALSTQLSMRSLKKILGHDFPPELLDMVPVDMALEHTIFPLRCKDDVLALAMSDPFAVDVTDFLEKMHKKKILPVLAPSREILAAIREHYLKGKVGQKEEQHTPCILVVDDSPTVSGVLRAALEREGFCVIQASDGLEALKLALTNKPRLILCDTVMPRMDGFGLLRALSAHKETAAIPAILLTSKASAEEEQKALSAGFFDFIAKPVNALRIISRVRRALEMTSPSS